MSVNSLNLHRTWNELLHDRKKVYRKIGINTLNREYPELGEQAVIIIENCMRLHGLNSVAEYVKRLNDRRKKMDNTIINTTATSSFVLLDMMFDKMNELTMRHELHLLFTLCCLGYGPYPDHVAYKLGFEERNMRTLSALGLVRVTQYGVIMYPFMINYMSSRKVRVLQEINMLEVVDRAYRVFDGAIQSQWELSMALNLWHIITQFPGLSERYYRLSINIVRAMERVDRSRAYEFVETYWMSVDCSSPTHLIYLYEWGILLFDRQDTQEQGVRVLLNLCSLMPVTHFLYNWLCLVIGDHYRRLGCTEKALMYYNKSFVSYQEQYNPKSWEVEIIEQRIESMIQKK